MNRKIALSDWVDLIVEKLDANGEVHLNASGVSMKPLFVPTRDVIVLRKEAISLYDMILYRRLDGQFVVHRIVGINRGNYILRGDAQYIDEYNVQPSQVIAKVVRFTRKNKEYDCNHWLYRLYVWVWMKSYRLRRFIYRVKNYLRRKMHG